MTKNKLSITRNSLAPLGLATYVDNKRVGKR